MTRLSVDRNLDWEGCFNARDLGGLPTTDGRATSWRAVIRSDSLDHLSPKGWSSLRAYGVRTILDLRNDDERESEGEARPTDLTTVHVALDDVDDAEFWEYVWSEELDGTPLYYRPFLDRKPERCAAAVAAIARAEPGGVVFHCGGGRDRTGLVSLLLLALVGVPPDEIASDYELSNARLPPFWAARGWEDQRPEIEAILARRQTTARALLLELLTSLDAEASLRSAGLGDGEIAAVRARLLEPECQERSA